MDHQHHWLTQWHSSVCMFGRGLYFLQQPVRNPPSCMLLDHTWQVDRGAPTSTEGLKGVVSLPSTCSHQSSPNNYNTANLLHNHNFANLTIMSTTMTSKTLNLQRSAQTVIRPSTVSSFARPLAARPGYSVACRAAKQHEDLDSDSYQV